MKKSALILCLLALVAANAHADQIVLKDGRIFTGEIIQKTGRMVKMNIDGNPITFFTEEIASPGFEPGETAKPGQYIRNDERYKLAKQLIQISAPAQETVARFFNYNKHSSLKTTESQRNKALADTKLLKAIDQIRLEAILKYYTKDDLELAIKLASDRESMGYLRRRQMFLNESTAKIETLLQGSLKNIRK